MIGQRKEREGLPKDGAFIKSIVSTNMADAIAKYYGIQLVEVLTGFKFIGQKMLEFETKKAPEPIYSVWKKATAA